MKHIVMLVLSTLCVYQTTDAKSIHSHQAANKLLGENWKILGRSSFGAGSTALTISTPGNYILSETIDSSASTTVISITANDVVLDLGGHTINGGDSAGAGITIANSAQNIVIQNGSIRATTGNGIVGGTGLRNIYIDKVALNNTGTADCITFSSGNGFILKNIICTCDGSSTGSGITFTGVCYAVQIENFSISGLNGSTKHGISFANGCYGITIKKGKIAQVDGSTNNSGINFTSTCYDITLEEISIANSGGLGIQLNGSYGVKIKNITIANIVSYGITTSGAYNVCIDDFHISKATSAAVEGGGIKLNTASDNIIIRNGTISNITNSSGAYGINVTGTEGLFIENVTVTNVTDNALEIATTACKNVHVTNFDVSSCGAGINIGVASQDLSFENISIANATSGSITIEGATQGVTIQNALLSGGTDGISIAGAATGIKLKNIEMYTPGAAGIVVAGAAGNIQADTITIINATTNGISLEGSGAYGIRFNNISISGSTENAIKVSQLCYNLAIENFEITSPTYNGIHISNYVIGFSLKNGTITTVPETYHPLKIEAPVYNCIIDTLTSSATGLGILFGTGALGGTIAGVTLRNTHVDFVSDASSYGIKISDTSGLVLENCTVQNVSNGSPNSQVVGILLSTCTNVHCTNVSAGSITDDSALGFSLSGINGAVFTKCSSKGNNATDTTGTYTCAGFYINNSTACTFEDCVSSGHRAPREAMGFYSNNSKGITFNNCESSRCAIVNSTGHNNARFAGFYSKDGAGNTWKNCLSNNHFAGNTSTNDGAGAFGFYLSSESQANLSKCVAQANGSTTSHAANAIGFYLDDTVGATPTDCTYCQISECKALANCTSATSGSTAYGFRDDATDTTNIILDCYAASNTDGATPSSGSNYSMDLPIGGTTQANWPIVEANMDSIIDLANRSDFFNVGITS